MRIGENYSLEYTVELTVPVNNEAAVEVDPITTAPSSATLNIAYSVIFVGDVANP